MGIRRMKDECFSSFMPRRIENELAVVSLFGISSCHKKSIYLEKRGRTRQLIRKFLGRDGMDQKVTRRGRTETFWGKEEKKKHRLGRYLFFFFISTPN